MRDSVLFEILKILLLPIALVYGLIVRIRNKLYDKQIYKSVRFDIPVISIGNLSFGGTGKTPHIEYLIDLLNPYFKISTLSRGYRRKSRGFIIANNESNALHIGDEPMQFKTKYDDVVVAVGENRMLAIPEILGIYQGVELILLDDAYQHRAVNPGLSILLTDYNHLYTKDKVLPLGRLREPSSSADRADIIIVSKCPPEMNLEEKAKVKAELAPKKYQKIYFSYLEYGHTYYIFNREQKLYLDDMDVLLVSGIANNNSVVENLRKTASSVNVQEYPDHHYFDRYDLENIRDAFNNLESSNKVIVTTEKDAMRLNLKRNWLIQNKLPVFVLPVYIKFFPESEDSFRKDIFSFMEYYMKKDIV